MTPVSVNVAAGIGRITLDRPEQMNAVNVELGVELERAVLALGSDPTIQVIVIRGAGGNFCAGGDFAEVERLRTEGPPALRSLFVSFRRACDAITAIDVPVVAAVEGVAAAGGVGLMHGADILLVSHHAPVSPNHTQV